MEDDEMDSLFKDLGFKLVPIESLIQAYEAMTEYLCFHTGLDRQSLSEPLKKLYDLLGEEECYKLELDEIVSWVKAL
jgi:hypothetical protein